LNLRVTSLLGRDQGGRERQPHRLDMGESYEKVYHLAGPQKLAETRRKTMAKPVAAIEAEPDGNRV
jgi:hypothetical protein